MEALFYMSELPLSRLHEKTDNADSDDSTQKILQHARMAEQGLIARDPIKESIGLELDMINILCVLLLFAVVAADVDVVL